MESMSRDIHRAALDHKDARLDKELQKFLKHALGTGHQPQRQWSSSVSRTVAGRLK
jgi:hypothetical protein